MSASPARVAVVGGGISGLAAAWHLSRAPGVRVVLLEGRSRLGGLLLTGDVGGVQIDLGAEAVLARRPEAVGLIAEAGLGDSIEYPRTGEVDVFARGSLRPLPATTIMGVPAATAALDPLLEPADVARVAAEPLQPAAPPLAADIDVAGLVAARMGQPVVDLLVEPLLGAVYAGHANRLSLRATVPALWETARHGGSLLQAAAAARAPASGPVFGGVVGGVGRLPGQLANGLAARGVEIRTSTTVRGLERTPGGWRLTLGPAVRPEALDADAVVIAVPPTPAARLLAHAAPSAAAELAVLEAASVAVIAALVPQDALAAARGSGVLVPPVERLAVKAVTISSAKWAWVDRAVQDEHPGMAAIRMSLGRAGEPAVLQRDDAELAELALADLAILLGRPAPARAWTVARWGGALPQYAVGHLDRVARLRSAVAAQAGLAICGAALDGVGIAACVAAARRAAGEVLQAVVAAGRRIPS